MFYIKVVQKIKTQKHFMSNSIFTENHAVLATMWEKMAEPDKARRLRIPR